MVRRIYDILYQSAEKLGDKKALFFKERSMTYGQIAGLSQRLAAILHDVGIQKGDRVAFFLEKRFEKVVAIFGILSAGAVMVPVKRLSQPHQVAYIVHNADARVLITTYSRLRNLMPLLNKMPTLELILVIDWPSGSIDMNGRKLALINWAETIENSATPHFVDHNVIEHDLAAILYTSGSTGMPKGVVLNHLNIVAGANSVSEYLKNSADDRLLAILSFGFDYGLSQLTTAFLHGAQVVLLDHLFSQDIVNAVQKYQVTGLAAVAATWNQLLQIPWDHLKMSSLRYITNSGGAIPENYVRELRRRLPETEIYLMYGLTEAFRSTFLNPALVDQKPTSMGQAIPGAEILVLDSENRAVKPGEVGELVHRGPLVAQGYWKDPELTAFRYRRNPLQPSQVILPEIVVYSGDYVKMDADGDLYFVGRRDEMIKCAGNRVSPTEVEEVIYASGQVQDAIALGIPDDIYGHVIWVVVVLRPGLELLPEALIAHCKSMLPPYMVPREILIRPELPHNATGKLDRALVKKEILASLPKSQEVK